jgi:hypothetical protein
MIHVFLEFPLDARTIVDVAAGLIRRNGLTPSSTHARPDAPTRRKTAPARS